MPLNPGGAETLRARCKPAYAVANFLDFPSFHTHVFGGMRCAFVLLLDIEF
jgi:hypothetical protein